MSEVEALREQVASLTARLTHLEKHHVALPPTSTEPKPNGALTARLDAAYAKAKPRHQRNLVMRLQERYGSLSHADNLAKAGTQRQPFDLLALPRVFAADMTGETYAADELARARSVNGAVDNSHRIARLEVEAAAMARHTQDLLEATELPPIPAELQAKWDKLTGRHKQNHAGDGIQVASRH